MKQKTKILIGVICILVLVLGGACFYFLRSVPVLRDEEPWAIFHVKDQRNGDDEEITEKVNRGKLLQLFNGYERKNIPQPLKKGEFEAAQIVMQGKEGEETFFVMLGQENKICFIEGSGINGYEILEGEKLRDEVLQLIDEGAGV